MSCGAGEHSSAGFSWVPWGLEQKDTGRNPVLWKDPVPGSDIGGEGDWIVQVSTKRGPPGSTLVMRRRVLVSWRN